MTPNFRYAMIAALVFAVSRLPQAYSAVPREVKWKKVVVDPKFRAEGASVADVNRDGKPDIMAGSIWYEAPDWKPHTIYAAKDLDPATEYSACFHSFAQDVDKDGWTDQIVIGFPGGKASWFKNPGKSDGPWAEKTINEQSGNESPIYANVNRDKQPDLVFGVNNSVMAWWDVSPEAPHPFLQHTFTRPGEPGAGSFAHGLGVGDINGDGRADVLCNKGFWIAPSDPKTSPWKYVAADLGPDCAHMYTYDFDGDGDMDVISSSAHAIGVWWYEQTQGGDSPKFTQHLIDDTYSQSHAMMMADLNGDKQPDFITGKRKWAHGPTGDVNPGDPGVLYWYEFRRKDGKVDWVRHLIDDSSGVGTQFTVADVNRDRRPDLVIANKNGVFYFEQMKNKSS